MVTSNSITQPRISANQLGEFVFATTAKKKRILQDQKYGNILTSPYYQPAQAAILAGFDAGIFDNQVLESGRIAILDRPADSSYQLIRRANNAEMVRRFSEISTQCAPPQGDYTFVKRNARLDIDGVTVSVRPEIVTTCNPHLFSYTKLRFSKSPVSNDASDIVLLVLLKYGQQQSTSTSQLDPSSTKLIDCFARRVITGHSIPRVREVQLARALREIIALWPSIPPHGTPLSDLGLAG